MTEQPSPTSSAARSRRAGTRVVSVEVTDRHIKALMDNGLVSTAEPDVALGIRRLMGFFSAGVFRVNAERFYAAMQATGVDTSPGHAPF